MTDAITLHDLRFRWRRDLPLCLDIPQLAVPAGARVFLHGPSGSGKSTLLGLLGGVLVPEQGSVTVLGQSLSALGSRARDRFRADHIGFLFQQFNLIPYLPVIDNVLLPCRFSHRRAGRTAAQGEPVAVAQSLLEALDLSPSLWQRDAASLSVGQQQRVALARALIGSPDILIADEPTSALDADRQQAFLDLLLSACEQGGATLLFVSHDQRLATHFTHTLSLAALNRAGSAEAA